MAYHRSQIPATRAQCVPHSQVFVVDLGLVLFLQRKQQRLLLHLGVILGLHHLYGLELLGVVLGPDRLDLCPRVGVIRGGSVGWPRFSLGPLVSGSPLVSERPLI